MKELLANDEFSCEIEVEDFVQGSFFLTINGLIVTAPKFSRDAEAFEEIIGAVPGMAIAFL